MHLNAIIFQVRPACDALYRSPIEPWSEYLCGTQGVGPSPAYDPLEFAVKEAHRRGIELHAWFNPYRAKHSSSKSPVARTHVSRTRPSLVRTYGKHLWLDPGEKAVQDYTISVVLDVVRRYDIDGVHLDDYFYPYKEKDESGKEIDFPDTETYARYTKAGGTLSRGDWRRQNVHALIERMYREIKKAKPWVKFGISPFGIWRPGHPEQIKGFDPYDEIFADSLPWLKEGWVDYFTPQLYWRIGQKAQSYPVLLKWWTEQNAKNRHIWPGSYTSRVADGSSTEWPASEIVQQIETERKQPGASGCVHFSMVSLLKNRGGLADKLTETVYKEPALVPASPWLGGAAPNMPNMRCQEEAGGATVTWEPNGGGHVWQWVVQVRSRGAWTTRIEPSASDRIHLPEVPEEVSVFGVDRCGARGPRAVWRSEGTH